MVGRWWCNQALHYDTQRSHRGCFTDVWEVPHYPLEVLLPDQIATPPAGYVPTDAEVDARKALEEAQQNVARARGRGRGGRGGRARGQNNQGHQQQKGQGGRGSQDAAPDSSEMGSVSATSSGPSP